MHKYVRKPQIQDHKRDTRYDAYDRKRIELQVSEALYQYHYTYRQAYNTCYQRRYIFPDIQALADMDNKMTCKRQHQRIPQSIHDLPRKEIRQQADAEKRYKLLIHCQGKTVRPESPVYGGYLWEAIKQLLIFRKEPLKAHDLFHIMENEDNGE